MKDYEYGSIPTKEQISESITILKMERFARWQSMMTEEEKHEIDQAHNVCIFMLREYLNSI